MNTPSIAPEQSIAVIFRVEPGCLGPDGPLYVDEFCSFAREQIRPLDAHFVRWQIIPRVDKTLPEIEYFMASKKLSREQAEKYLAVFKRDIDDFEGAIQENISLFIDQFFGR